MYEQGMNEEPAALEGKPVPKERVGGNRSGVALSVCIAWEFVKVKWKRLANAWYGAAMDGCWEEERGLCSRVRRGPKTPQRTIARRRSRAYGHGRRTGRRASARRKGILLDPQGRWEKGFSVFRTCSQPNKGCTAITKHNTWGQRSPAYQRSQRTPQRPRKGKSRKRSSNAEV